MQSLSEINAGEACTVKWMFGNIQIMDFLRSRNMKEGSLIRVLQQGGGGTIVRTDGHCLALGSDIAQRIKV